jgi:hypothetical protein
MNLPGMQKMRMRQKKRVCSAREKCHRILQQMQSAMRILPPRIILPSSFSARLFSTSRASLEHFHGADEAVG